MGGPINDMILCCQKEGMRTIDVRHEQGAAMMAHAYSRVSGKPGVCMATSGPGTINMATGVFNAFADAAPMIAIGGASALNQFGMEAFQECDQESLYRPITKASTRISFTKRIPEQVATAFRTALTGKPGPVFIDLPGDIIYGNVEAAEVEYPTNYRTETRAYGDPALVGEAIRWLLAAERPLILAGSGVLWSKASAELQRFVDLTGIPFYTTPLARGIVPEDHPRCFTAARTYAFREADVFLVIGTRFNLILGFGKPPRFNPSAKVIMVNIDAAEIGHNRPIDLGIVGDARAVLQQLAHEGQGKAWGSKYLSWVNTLKQEDEDRWKRSEPLMTSSKVPIHPLRLCYEVRQFLKRDAILVVDVHEILNFGRQSIPTYYPGHRLNSGVTGCMGVGVPFGVGAKAAKPDKQVLVLHGDGSFGLNCMEIDTALRHHLPVVTVVSNNGGWTAVEKGLEKPGRDLGFSRYERMFEVLGAHAEYVEKPEEIRPALERAFASGRAAVVNVRVDETARSSTARFSFYRM
jgi:acetolactate synthase-1/2/3 large subunit